MPSDPVRIVDANGSPLSGSNPLTVRDGQLASAPTPSGAFSSLTVSTVAVQLAALNAATTHVLVFVETNPIRVRFDGTAPTATVGHLLPAGYSAYWPTAWAAAAKFIRQGAADGVVTASPFTLS